MRPSGKEEHTIEWQWQSGPGAHLERLDARQQSFYLGIFVPQDGSEPYCDLGSAQRLCRRRRPPEYFLRLLVADALRLRREQRPGR